MVDESLGQTALGVWDFGWSIVHYLGLAMVGIGSSVNRFVARYRSSGESEKLSRIVSSVIAIQLLIAVAVALAALVLAHILPLKMAHKLGDQSAVAGQVVLFLGLALAIQMAFDAFRGILTGCHKWTIYNALNAGSYAISSVLMLIALMQGFGLAAMAMIFLAVTVVTELFRVYFAVVACPTIEYRLANVNAYDISRVFRFGVKNVLIYLPRVIIQQTVNIFVVMYLGPAMLAILARPLALVGHVSTIINKFSFVLTPTAGSLQGGDRIEELRSFATVSMRASWIFAVLPCTYLFVLGDKLVDLWMGEGYANWAVIAILTAGSVLPMAKSAVVAIMAGMNEHGRIAKYSLILSVVTIAIGIPVVTQFGWTLEVASFLMVLPTNIGIGLVAVVIGCKVLKVSAWQYVRDVIRDPLLVGLVCGLALWMVRLYGPQASALSLLTGAVVQLIVVLVFLHKDIRTAFATLRGSQKDQLLGA